MSIFKVALERLLLEPIVIAIDDGKEPDTNIPRADLEKLYVYHGEYMGVPVYRPRRVSESRAILMDPEGPRHAQVLG